MNFRKTLSMRRAPAVASCAALALAACGGGGSDSPSVPSALTIGGTAAKGAALPGAAISIKCAAGAATTTTAADGKYAVTITGAGLPCAVRVVGSDGSVFHSVVPGPGSTGTFVANVTPLTELMTAAATGTSPGTFFDGFGSGTVLTPASLAQANDYLKIAVAGVADLTGSNPVTDTLIPGNSLDQKIEGVVAGLAAAGITIAQFTASIAANPAAPSVVASPLAASATDCGWLKSGKYRLIDRLEVDPKFRFQAIQVDAAALTVTDADNVVNALTSDGSCQFSIDADVTLKVLVSSSGMVVFHAQSKTIGTDRAVFLGVPEQTLPVSEFSGTWNLASWQPVNIPAAGSIVASNAEITVDATGQITATKECVGLGTCASGSAPFAKFVTNAAGGFDLVEDGAVVGRLFLFKTIAGKKVAILLDDENSLAIAVPKDTLTLPTVGTVNGFRSLQINGNDSVSPLTEDSNTITAVDSVAKTVTRLQASNNRVDTLTYDRPRDGLRYRVGNSCTISGVLMIPACAEVVQLPLSGMGITITLSAATQPTQQFYQFSVNKP